MSFFYFYYFFKYFLLVLVVSFRSFRPFRWIRFACFLTLFRVLAHARNSQRMNDPLVNIWIIAEKCPSQLSSGKIFWKLLTVKQQTGRQDLATVHLV